MVTRSSDIVVSIIHEPGPMRKKEMSPAYAKRWESTHCSMYSDSSTGMVRHISMAHFEGTLDCLGGPPTTQEVGELQVSF